MAALVMTVYLDLRWLCCGLSADWRKSVVHPYHSLNGNGEGLYH
jgi:hypothetical protein